MTINYDDKNILNYFLIQKNLNPIQRNYKIDIKNLWCNARCPMCEDRLCNITNKDKFIKILYESISHILKDKIKFKNIQILWWEPLIIFDDLLKIISIRKKNNISIDFPTNRSLLTIEKIEKLLLVWLNNFTFSLDFPNTKHNYHRKLNWNFEKIIDFTKYLKNKWVYVQWNTVIWKYNIDYIKNFWEIYNNYTYPNTHNFIEIEEWLWEYNWKFYNENHLSDYFKKKADNLIDDLKNFLWKRDIIIIKNWFKKNFLWKSWNNESKKCFIPLKTITYKIYEDNYKIIPCYINTNYDIENLNNFIKDAVNIWCDKCNSSYKENFNIYFLNLIKKYKLNNK